MQGMIEALVQVRFQVIALAIGTEPFSGSAAAALVTA